MLKMLCFCSFVLIGSTAYGQYGTTIRSARPGQAFGPFTTGHNIFQVQTGFTFDSFNNDAAANSGNGFGHFLSLRYGLTETFEIRSAIGLRRDNSTQLGIDSQIGGINVFSTGVRYNIKDGMGKKASYAIQTGVRFNFVDEDYNIKNIAPTIILLHGQNITDNLGLTTNWGLSWNGFDSAPSGFYVINLSTSITESLGVFLEAYGGIMKDDLTIRYDTGLAYLINNNLQIDISAGIGSNNGITDNFVDAGISWRTGKWKGQISNK